MTTSLLAEWDNFYVIAGSSADAKRVNFTALRAYVSALIVHFGAVGRRGVEYRTEKGRCGVIACDAIVCLETTTLYRRKILF